MRPLSIRPEAEEEAREAARWYEGEAPGLGAAFLEVLQQILDAAVDNPYRFPVVHRDVRRALLKRFPYGVFFRIRPKTIKVLGIVHLARDPDRWRKRR